MLNIVKTKHLSHEYHKHLIPHKYHDIKEVSVVRSTDKKEHHVASIALDGDGHKKASFTLHGIEYKAATLGDDGYRKASILNRKGR